jgi:hypothetical protein
MRTIKAKQLSSDEHLQTLFEIESYGYSKVINYLDLDTVFTLKKIVEEEYLKNTKLGIKKYPGAPERDINDKIIYNLQNLDHIFIELLSTKYIKSIATKYLNDPYYRFLPDETPNYILHYYNARSSGSALDLHIDSYVPSIGSKPTMMQFVLLLEDSTAINGCTIAVPGSHQSGRYTNREIKNVDELTGNAGDLILWDSRLWHGTRENKSGKSRWALVATLGMWWIKPSLDIPRGMNEKVYSKCTDEQKQLLGFCSIPPIDPMDRTNTKCGYEFLKSSIAEYNF